MIFENIGSTGSKAEIENSKPEEFPSLLPISMKVASKTIGQHLIFASPKEIDEIKNKVLRENRDGKIEAIFDGKEFTEKKLEEDTEYQELMKMEMFRFYGFIPTSALNDQLFYIDFKYESHKENK